MPTTYESKLVDDPDVDGDSDMLLIGAGSGVLFVLMCLAFRADRKRRAINKRDATSDITSKKQAAVEMSKLEGKVFFQTNGVPTLVLSKLNS